MTKNELDALERLHRDLRVAVTAATAAADLVGVLILSDRPVSAPVSGLATVTKHANQIEAFLTRVDPERNGMYVRKICDALRLSGSTWQAARSELLRRGTIEETSLPTDRYCTYRLVRK